MCTPQRYTLVHPRTEQSRHLTSDPVNNILTSRNSPSFTICYTTMVFKNHKLSKRTNAVLFSFEVPDPSPFLLKRSGNLENYLPNITRLLVSYSKEQFYSQMSVQDEQYSRWTFPYDTKELAFTLSRQGTISVHRQIFQFEQECIPVLAVGCIPSALYCTGGSMSPPPVNRMTDRCKNLSQTSFAGGNK